MERAIISAKNVPKNSIFVTKNKQYQATKMEGFDATYKIKADNGASIIIRADGCPFLNGHSWNVIKL